MLQNIIEATYEDDFFGTPTLVFLTTESLGNVANVQFFSISIQNLQTVLIRTKQIFFINFIYGIPKT
jgi:hypothetical protein